MWEYRLCKKTFENPSGEKEVQYSIHEVYYNSDGSIWAITENPVTIISDSKDEILGLLLEMADVVRKAILENGIIDLDTIKFSPRE